MFRVRGGGRGGVYAWLVSWLIMSVAVGACSGSAAPTITAEVRAYCGDAADAVERRIDELLPRLTLTQKTTLTRGAFVGWGGWVAPGIEELGIPPLGMLDGPRGVSSMAGYATAFPVGMARGATFDPELERRVGDAIGREARLSGTSVILAPTMNVLRHPRWGRAQETYGEDPHHIGRMAAGFVGGAQGHVLATAKHYAGNSIEATRMKVDVTMDERTLREVYLPHFAYVVRDARVAAVMTAYNSVNGSYCAENDHLVRDILKSEWGFAGFTVSDWGGTHDTAGAALAGLDLEMPVESVYGEPLRLAVESGAVDEASVDDMVRRLLRARFCYRVDTDPPVIDPSAREAPEDYALAREVAERSMVLLANRGPLLPLERSALRSIVVTGPLADVENIGDHHSSEVTPSSITTALEGLTAAAGGAEVRHLAAPPAAAEERAAVAAADVVIVVAGLGADDESEAHDRTSLELPADQAAWIAAVAALSSRVVLVLEGGSAFTEAPVFDEVAAIVVAWYPGVEGGTALARVLLGDVNPSGRLPISFPRAEADLPVFDNVATAVDYGYFHGYRHLDSEGVAPLFPYGFGLSYTTFAYANLQLASPSLQAADTLRVTVDVSNTGSRAGRETVQLYVGAEGSAVTPRFVRELRAFTQVDLAPSETRAVALEVPVAELAYWDVASGAFAVEPATYRVEVGSSSRDLLVTDTFTVGR